MLPTERAVAAERAAREAIAQVRGAWAQLIGEGELERLEASLRRLPAALWPAA